LTTVTIFGGVGAGPQIAALRRGVDIVVACPGRLNDHIEAGHAKLDAVEITVLDEADHMADLGFLPVVRRLLDRTPRSGQRLLFSATLDGGVDVLVRQFMRQPVTHSVDSAHSPVSTMEHHVLHLRQEDRLSILVDLASAPGRTLVFTRTKHGANRLTQQLQAAGIRAAAIHGNKSQGARTRALSDFRELRITALIATEVAARGLDIRELPHVVNFELPHVAEDYVHRIGRTARAGSSGVAISLVAPDEAALLRDIEKLLGHALPASSLPQYEVPAAASDIASHRDDARCLPRRAYAVRPAQGQPRRDHGAHTTHGAPRARRARGH
jgi:superfamily II DNA/RNA helicase